MSATIGVRNGAVYLSAQICHQWFRGIDAVIVLIRDNQLQILPVQQQASGGCLLKIRNAAGDRVAAAQDVFAANDLLDWQDDKLAAQWSCAQCALLASLPAVF